MVDPAAAQTVDVVPTIAKLIGVEIPWEVDGLPAGERKGGPVEVTDYQGSPVRSSLPRVLEMGRQFLAEWSGMLTYGKGWDALIRSGPGSHLIGGDVPATLPRAEGRAELPEIPDPGSDEVLAVVDGTVSGVEVGAALAIAVNGRIEAVTSTIQAQDEVRYQAVLPPSVYESPIERVQVLQVLPDQSFALLGEGPDR